MKKAKPEWAGWALADWNKALIDAIFLGREARSGRISRIDTTDQFIAKCTGDEGCDGEEARKSLLSCFGTDPSEISHLYRLKGSEERETRKAGHPPYFGQLYLSLLAASADERTYTEGNFRKRLALMLDLPSEPTLQSGHLSGLWKLMEKWTKQRSASKADCRILVLPDPGHETIIGYSKRLAFPTYKDQERLARLFGERQLAPDEDFKVIVRAIQQRSNEFTGNFLGEFQIFREHVRQGRNSEAYDTPFWCAIRDVNWEIERKESLRSGKLRAELEVDDYDAFIRLFVDERACEILGDGFATRTVKRPDGCKISCSPVGKAGWGTAALRTELERHAEFGSSKLLMSLRRGGVVMLPDEFGRFSTDGHFSNAGPACVVLEHGGAILERECKHLNVKWIEVAGREGWEAWKGYYFPRLTRASLDRLAAVLPNLSTGVVRWTPPRPTVTGGAWVGQALLLNPATAVRVWVEELGDARYELRDANGESVDSGALQPSENAERHEFRIPSAAIEAAREGATIELTNRTSNGQEWSTRIQVICSVDEGLPGVIANHERWLLEDEHGSLSPITASGSPTGLSTQKRRPSNDAWRAQLAKPLVNSGQPSLSRVTGRPLQELDPPFSWLAEVLSARFQSRQSMGWSELLPHLESVQDKTGHHPRQMIQLLVASGWLLPLEQARSHYLHYVPKPASMVASRLEGRFKARLSGIVTSSKIHRIKRLLADDELARELVDTESPLSLGAIEIEFANDVRGKQIAELLGDTIYIDSRSTFPAAHFGHVANASASDLADIGKSGGLEIFSTDTFEWSYCSRNDIPKIALVRRPGFPRNWYWIVKGNRCWKTVCRTWAFLLLQLARGQSLGQVALNGDCRLSRAYLTLPYPILRWWRDWGGGVFSTARGGGLVLSGGGGREAWRAWGDWMALDRMDTARDPMPEARRSLALQLSRRRVAGF